MMIPILLVVTILMSMLAFNDQVYTPAETIDTPAANIDLLSPLNKTYYSSSIPVTFELDEMTSWIGYSLDSQANITITENTFISADDGPHQIVMYANDTQGSTSSSQTVCFTVNAPFYDPWKTSFIGLGEYPIVGFATHNDKLYAVASSTLYVYDGRSWGMLTAPTYVISLESYKGKLIVGGEGGIYAYNGASFNVIFTVPTYIRLLGIYNNTLYAGTVLDEPPILYYCQGSAENLSNWQVDTGFSNILNFSGFFGSIDSFAVFDNEVYVSSGGTVYSCNETGWRVVKAFIDVNAFLDMKIYDRKLCLASRDVAWRKPYGPESSGFSGRVFEFDGTTWTAIFDYDYWIYSLEAYDGKLYVGTADRIYAFNGADWSLSFEAAEGSYYAISMATFSGEIQVGMGNGYIFAFGHIVNVSLTMSDPHLSNAYRWLDVANQAYSSSYRDNYNYSQATVTIMLCEAGDVLSGKLVARNLKPNFAYQLKLVGAPSMTDNERIGLAGRWWQETWNGTAWSSGSNLNNKGNGYSPSPNDIEYFDTCYVTDSTSPTGYHFRYTGYLPFAYFITDSYGDCILCFTTGSSYHVLWKTTQRSPTIDDGALVTTTFEPDPSQAAYDVHYPRSTVSIFGEWERLPMGGVNLSIEQYNCQVTLTEESFHGIDPLAGSWAAAMSGEASFTITG
jgi:hypothetical protein